MNSSDENRSNFGMAMPSGMTLYLILAVIAALVFYLYKKKKLPGMSSFGRRR